MPGRPSAPSCACAGAEAGADDAPSRDTDDAAYEYAEKDEQRRLHSPRSMRRVPLAAEGDGVR